MAPAQVVDEKDLPPEVLATPSLRVDAVAEPVTVPVVLASSDAAVVDAPAPLAPSALAPVAFAAPGVTPLGMGAVSVSAPEPLASAPSSAGWEQGLQLEALGLLESGRLDVWDVLTRRFETQLIQTALANTRGRRIEAAHKLGIGRNTITRKIQELNLE